jgi:hypothetical protein
VLAEPAICAGGSAQLAAGAFGEGGCREQARHLQQDSSGINQTDLKAVLSRLVGHLAVVEVFAVFAAGLSKWFIMALDLLCSRPVLLVV